MHAKDDVFYILQWLGLFGAALSQAELSAADKQTILGEHNRLRGMVSPAAANMLRMVREFLFFYFF